MAELDEIHIACKTIYSTGNHQLTLLHCVAEYPPELSSINLLNISTFQKEFPDCPIGLSDHSPGVEVSTAAIALGACVIEKHITLDKSCLGWDNDMAMEPDEMKQLVRNCFNVYTAMGSLQRIIGDPEMIQRQNIRRSIVMTKNCTKGHILKKEDLDCKRPGTGILPGRLESLVGLKLKRDLAEDELLQETDFEPEN